MTPPGLRGSVCLLALLVAAPPVEAAGRRAVYKGTIASVQGIYVALVLRARWDFTRTQLAGVVRCTTRRSCGCFCLVPKGPFVASYNAAGEFVGGFQGPTGVSCLLRGVGDFIVVGDYVCEDRFGIVLDIGSFRLVRKR